MRGAVRFLVAGVVVLAGLGAGALADVSHNAQAPIDVAAGHLELLDKANRAIFSGNVQVKQAEMTLDADRLTIFYTGQVVGGSPQVSRLDAAGGVRVTRPNQSARSQYAVYDLNKHLITMLGNVSLDQGGNTVNGGRLTLNLDSGRAVIDGSSIGAPAGNPGSGDVTTAPNGRVTGHFSVPDRSQ